MIMNTAKNIHVVIFVWKYSFISLGEIPRTELLDPMVNILFSNVGFIFIHTVRPTDREVISTENIFGYS